MDSEKTKLINDYDYIIIGASPYGLTCAYYLSKINKSNRICN